MTYNWEWYTLQQSWNKIISEYWHTTNLKNNNNFEQIGLQNFENLCQKIMPYWDLHESHNCALN